MTVLAKDAPVALWRQLKILLRDRTLAELAPGDRIPTEQELCEQYGVSRITVRQAISSLVKEGILATQRGRGTYVLPPKISSPLNSIPSPIDARTSRVVLYSVDRIAADPWQASRLAAEPGESLYRVRRLRLVENEPIAYFTFFLPTRFFPELTRPEMESENFHQLLTYKSGLTPEVGDETIECIQADSFRADILQIPIGSPLLVVETRARLGTGEIIEFSRAYHRADRIQLTQEVSWDRLHSRNW